MSGRNAKLTRGYHAALVRAAKARGTEVTVSLRQTKKAFARLPHNVKGRQRKAMERFTNAQR